jgi:hypothetical protein
MKLKNVVVKHGLSAVITCWFLFGSGLMFAADGELNGDVFQVTLPDGFVMNKSTPVEDFDVYHIKKDDEMYVGIYVGNHPDFPSVQRNKALNYCLSVDGDLKVAVVSVWKGDILVEKEILKELEEIGGSQDLHAWTSIDLSPEQMLLADKIISSISVKGNQGLVSIESGLDLKNCESSKFLDLIFEARNPDHEE